MSTSTAFHAIKFFIDGEFAYLRYLFFGRTFFSFVILTQRFFNILLGKITSLNLGEFELTLESSLGSILEHRKELFTAGLAGAQKLAQTYYDEQYEIERAKVQERIAQQLEHNFDSSYVEIDENIHLRNIKKDLRLAGMTTCFQHFPCDVRSVQNRDSWER